MGRGVGVEGSNVCARGSASRPPQLASIYRVWIRPLSTQKDGEKRGGISHFLRSEKREESVVRVDPKCIKSNDAPPPPPPLPSEVGKKRCACFALPNGANGGEKRELERMEFDNVAPKFVVVFV